MNGNFSYYNPTKLFFGDKALDFLPEELSQYGHNIMLVYGGGSIKANGIYDGVTEALKKSDKKIFEFSGVGANPTYEKLLSGCAFAKDNAVDFILAVGGGSVCDFSKAVGVSAWCGEDPWEKYYIRGEKPSCKTIPVGCVLTMAGTGSEMNSSSVITKEDKENKLKICATFGADYNPKFTVLNPCYTFSVPRYQMVAGIFDIMSHILEQYLSGSDDCASDYLSEGLMRSLVKASLKAIENSSDYEARSNIMWTATWALNTLLSRGKTTDWQTHMIGHAISAYTNATHGMTLAAVTPAYLRHILKPGAARLARLAVNVWGIDPSLGDEECVAEKGIEEMERWMDTLGLVRHITELGVTNEMVEPIAGATLIKTGGYKVMDKQEIIDILKESK